MPYFGQDGLVATVQLIIISKIVKGTLSTSVCEHMLECDHIVTWDDFKVLGRESNNWLLEIKESLFIKRDKPSLNKNIHSQELFLF